MNTEIISHKGKKVTKKTKRDGSISYTLKGVYVGTDVKTGKRVTTTISARTLKQLDRKIFEAKQKFEQNGSTKAVKQTISNFEDLAEVWFSTYKLLVTSHNTINKVRGYLDTYIIPRFGNYQPDMIETIEVQQWVNDLAQRSKKCVESGLKTSPKGSAKDFGAVMHKLSDIFDYGIVNFGLKSNPVKGVKIPPKPKSSQQRVMVLHDEDLTTWLTYLNELDDTRANRRFRIICNTLLASALRINELLALTIDDLDFKTCEITVNKTLMWQAANKKLGKSGKVVCKQSAKTDSGNRKVAVPLSILEDLASFRDEMNSYFYKHGLPESDLIFPTIYGGYMCDRNERATLKKRLVSLGLPDYGFHLFRHTHASLMLNAGANWKELQLRMGHKSISTTMDTYAELSPRRKQEAVEMFNNKIGELIS